MTRKRPLGYKQHTKQTGVRVPIVKEERTMNIVVVYDSQFGNTEQLAQTIAETLREWGQVRTVRVEHAHPLGLQGVDLLILGCPTQQWRPTRAMHFLLECIPFFLEYIPLESLSRLAVACFDTRLGQPRWMTGSAAGVMTKKLRKMGVSHLFPPESFLVKGMHGPLQSGEVERAANWARMLREKVQEDTYVER
jgi:flavodoxin